MADVGVGQSLGIMVPWPWVMSVTQSPFGSSNANGAGQVTRVTSSAASFSGTHSAMTSPVVDSIHTWVSKA